MDIQGSTTLQEACSRLRWKNGAKLTSEQSTCLKASAAGSDVFAVLPTGSGKSAIFQLPILILHLESVANLLACPIAVVIVPTISLIEDQVHQLNDCWGERISIGIHSREPTDEPQSDEHRLSCILDAKSRVSFIYTTPETVMHHQPLRKILRTLSSFGRLNCFVFDEVHCMSLWGERFRPDCLAVAGYVCTEFPSVRRVALTATATVLLQADIVSRLRLGMALHGGPSATRSLCFVKRPPFRENLVIDIRRRHGRQHTFFDSIVKDILACKPLRGVIIFARSIRECEELSLHLNECYGRHGIRSSAYHSEVLEQQRQAVYSAWMGGEVLNVIVATSSFSLGINNSDTVLIIHTAVPLSMEDYVQQIGRSARCQEGRRSVSILYYSCGDLMRMERMITEKTTQEQNAFAKLNIKSRSRKSNSGALETSGIATVRDHSTGDTQVDDELANTKSYRFGCHASNVDTVISYQLLRAQKMFDFVSNTKGVCRWKTIMDYFGYCIEGSGLDEARQTLCGTNVPCNLCDNCRLNFALRRPNQRRQSASAATAEVGLHRGDRHGVDGCGQTGQEPALAEHDIEIPPQVGKELQLDISHIIRVILLSIDRLNSEDNSPLNYNEVVRVVLGQRCQQERSHLSIWGALKGTCSPKLAKRCMQECLCKKFVIQHSNYRSRSGNLRTYSRYHAVVTAPGREFLFEGDRAAHKVYILNDELAIRHPIQPTKRMSMQFSESHEYYRQVGAVSDSISKIMAGRSCKEFKFADEHSHLQLNFTSGEVAKCVDSRLIDVGISDSISEITAEPHDGEVQHVVQNLNVRTDSLNEHAYASDCSQTESSVNSDVIEEGASSSSHADSDEISEREVDSSTDSSASDSETERVHRVSSSTPSRFRKDDGSPLFSSLGHSI